MSDFLKHVAATVAAIMGLLSLVQLIVVAFGGSIPPWAPAAAFKALEKRVDGVIVGLDSQRCEDWNRRIEQAQMRLSLMPAALFEIDNIIAARLEIRRIPGCAER